MPGGEFVEKQALPLSTLGVGAIIGLEDLREEFDEIKKKEKKTFFLVSSKWVEELIKYKIMIYKNIKIKELEKLTAYIGSDKMKKR